MSPAHPVRPCALITVNRAGLIVDWDAGRTNPLGWCEDTVRATPLTDLIDPAARARFHDWWTRLPTALPTRTDDGGIVTSLRTPQGKALTGVVHCEPSRLYPDTAFLFVYLQAGEPLPPAVTIRTLH